MNDAPDRQEEEKIPYSQYPELFESTWVLILTLIWGELMIWGLKQLPINEPFSLCLSTGGLILPALVWTMRSRFTLKSIFRLQYPGFYHLLLAIPFSIGVSIIVDAVDRWWSLLIPPDPEYVAALSRSVTGNTVYEVVAIVMAAGFLAPLFEEMLFRGLLQGVMEIRTSFYSAILWTAAIFSVFHGNFSLLLPLILLAIVLGAMVWRVDSIFPAVVAHSVNNLLMLYSMKKPDGAIFPGYLDGHHVALIWLSVAIVLAVISGYLYFRFPDENSLTETTE